MKNSAWNTHYERDKSSLSYPDENLVRMMKPYTDTIADKSAAVCLDLGCGSGRHMKLASELGIGHVVGTDIAYNGLQIAKQHGTLLVQGDGRAIPFKDNQFDIVITWGSLHYGAKKDFPKKLSEIKRVMKQGSCLFGTLRSSKDTMLKTGKHLSNDEWITNLSDINNSLVSFYSEKELVSYFTDFSSFSYGLMERTLLGSPDKIISHWYFRAIK